MMLPPLPLLPLLPYSHIAIRLHAQELVHPLLQPFDTHVFAPLALNPLPYTASNPWGLCFSKPLEII
jgi:hypothetical protein